VLGKNLQEGIEMARELLILKEVRIHLLQVVVIALRMLLLI